MQNTLFWVIRIKTFFRQVAYLSRDGKDVTENLSDGQNQSREHIN